MVVAEVDGKRTVRGGLKGRGKSEGPFFRQQTLQRSATIPSRTEEGMKVNLNWFLAVFHGEV